MSFCYYMNMRFTPNAPEEACPYDTVCNSIVLSWCDRHTLLLPVLAHSVLNAQTDLVPFSDPAKITGA
jgi:hypothetical protein